jgi:hypothetical protein
MLAANVAKNLLSELWRRVPMLCDSLNQQNVKSRHTFPLNVYAIFESALIFGRFPGYARLSFWKRQCADEDEYGTLVVAFDQCPVFN